MHPISKGDHVFHWALFILWTVVFLPVFTIYIWVHGWWYVFFVAVAIWMSISTWGRIKQYRIQVEEKNAPDASG